MSRALVEIVCALECPTGDNRGTSPRREEPKRGVGSTMSAAADDAAMDTKRYDRQIVRAPRPVAHILSHTYCPLSGC